MGDDPPIAVVGMGCVFPGAHDPATFWRNIVAKRDLSRQVPPGRWILDPREVLAAGPAADKVYSLHGCFVEDFALDPTGLRIDLKLLAELDPVYHLSLHAARQAFADAVAGRLDLRRVGVVLAAIALPTDSTSAFTREILGRAFEEALFERTGLPAANDDGPPRADAIHTHPLNARVAALPASIIAAALGLGGGSYTLDAACASSLYAVKLACDELIAGRADAMLAGGVSRPDCLYTQMGFSQLRALSPSGRCAPFDESADGLVVGEGAGVVVLKRLDDALRDQDRVHGVIRGIGLSNDIGGSLLAPESEGQLRAIREAYRTAGWSPHDVDFIECHGTGTPLGDAVEIQSLRTLWGETGWRPGQCAIGSVKSMIGHLLTAAGAAGLIKTLLALGAGTLPPSANYRRSAAMMALEGSAFRVQAEAGDWPRRGESTPRRAAINGFGFGGINAHVLIEEWDGGLRSTAETAVPQSVPRRSQQPAAIAIVGMAARFGGAGSLAAFGELVRHGETALGPRPADRWHGADALAERLGGVGGLRGAYLDGLEIPVGKYRLPPNEILEILPQQLLMLETAADALADAGMPLRERRPRMGAIIGMALDLNTTNFDLRWWITGQARRWAGRLGVELSEAEETRWRAGLQDAAGPALNATRTIGALGNIIASRIARECELGGPSFAVSCDEASGLKALEIAVRGLQRGEMDAAVVGAADLAGDVRAVLAARALRPVEAVGEGAAAVVLKRLEDARRDGNRVHAVIRGIDSAGGGGTLSGESGRSDVGMALERAVMEAGIERGALVRRVAAGPFPEQDEEAIERIIGYAGAASGMAGLVMACVAFGNDQEGPRIDIRELGAGRVVKRRYSTISATTSDGNSVCVVLEPAITAEAGEKHSDRRNVEKRESVDRSAGLAETDGPAAVRVPIGARPPRPPLPAGARASGWKARSVAKETEESQPWALAAAMHAEVARATAEAHEAFLRFTRTATEGLQSAFGIQQALLETGGGGEARGVQLDFTGETPAPQGPAPQRPAYSRELCLEFARGSAAKVLGPEFAEVDSFPVRVRLPDEPLMLVDRIVTIEGAKGSLSSGRIVTEHDVRPDAWYLDRDCCPACITVEAGQADLFLCSYLGIDLAVRGRRAYRLLDATVAFHRRLPRPNEMIRYDITIERFVRQGDVYLFFFHFDGTIKGEPVLTMRDGCAGFFTPEEIEHSGGIVLTADDAAPAPGRRPADWREPAPMARESYGDAAMAALRAGDLAGCFGPMFGTLGLRGSPFLPDGRMKLIDRVLELDPTGGRYGLGSIRAEADIHPDDWFLTCHFVDDRVMPGTLMYECCLHTLRFYLLRMGWVGEQSEVRYEPVPGLASSLKCRGPVTPGTRRATYQVEIKEIGYRPEPYAVADALMFADGRRIVQAKNMSLRLTGLTREGVEEQWRRVRQGSQRTAIRGLRSPRAPIFDKERMLEFAEGRPSMAFGEPYQRFDEGRRLARLPRPPYLFVDRVMSSEPLPWQLKAGGWIEAEYDVPPEAWYFRANRQASMPFCVLLECGLQACGWLAAYAGSALISETDLSFRNLDGGGVLYEEVFADAGTLTLRARMTDAAPAGGMIIERFEMEVLQAGRIVYRGDTSFGFFSEAALARQVGVREAAGRVHIPTAEEAARGRSFVLPDLPPLTPDDPGGAIERGAALPGRALRMVDRIDLLVADGGPHGLGYIRGSVQVDPQAWFFRAHFYQDPVWPGSLGLESFLQLLKVYALERWPRSTVTHRFEPIAIGRRHEWSYRGQIVPRNQRVEVQAVVTQIEEGERPMVAADGFLSVDGMVIYEMRELGVRLLPTP